MLKMAIQVTQVGIELTPEEKQTLTVWTKAGTTQQRLSQRARVIIILSEGLP
jgi:hypothetical protein